MLQANTDASTGRNGAWRRLAVGPVYRYVRAGPWQPWPAEYRQRLGLLVAIGLPVLVLCWLGAEAQFTVLDPHLTGVARVAEWLRLLPAGLHHTGAGYLQLLLVTTIPACLIWFAQGIYRWAVVSSTLLAPATSSGRPNLLDILHQHPVSSTGALMAILAATLRNWLPLILASSLAYSIVITIFQFNGELDLSSTDLYYLPSNLPAVFLRAACFVLYICLPLVLNTLLLLCFSGGIRTRSSAPTAGILMALAQVVYILKMPGISDNVHQGLELHNSQPYLTDFHSAACLLGVCIVIALIIALYSPVARTVCLTSWPLLLLAVVAYRPAILAIYDWFNYPAFDDLTNLIPTMVFGVGAMVSPYAVPFSYSWCQSSGGILYNIRQMDLVVPQTWIAFTWLQVGLIVVASWFAIRSIEARRREGSTDG